MEKKKREKTKTLKNKINNLKVLFSPYKLINKHVRIKINILQQ